MNRLLLAVALASSIGASGLCVTGCGESSKPDPQAPFMVFSKSSSTTPAGAVETLWHYIELEASPAAIYLFDPKVVGHVGPDLILGGLAAAHASIVGLTPQIEGQEALRAGMLVSVKTKSATQSRPRYYSFILRRFRSEWKIEYDSLTMAGITAFATAHAWISPSTHSAAQATAAGIAAAQKFRLAAVSTEKEFRSRSH